MGIVGVPGSGKSSTAKAVCARLNARGVPAANVPMDGFHYYRSAVGQSRDAEGLSVLQLLGRPAQAVCL